MLPASVSLSAKAPVWGRLWALNRTSGYWRQDSAVGQPLCFQSQAVRAPGRTVVTPTTGAPLRTSEDPAAGADRGPGTSALLGVPVARASTWLVRGCRYRTRSAVRAQGWQAGELPAEAEVRMLDQA